MKVVFYDDGAGDDAKSPLATVESLAERLGDVSPQVMPPTGFDTKRHADSAPKTLVRRLFYKTGEVTTVG